MPPELGPPFLEPVKGVVSFVGDSVSTLIHPLPFSLFFFFFPRLRSRLLPCCNTVDGEGYEDELLVNPARGLRGEGIRERRVLGESAVRPTPGDFCSIPDALTTMGRSST
jgi:hypothetical protein